MPIIQRLGSASARGFGFGKTGILYQRTVQESATIADSTNRDVSYDSVISETSVATDVIASLLNSLNQIIEVATGSDANEGERGYISVVNETATISDLISTIGNQNITVAEIATATDAVSNIGSFDRSVTETGSITDTPQGAVITTNDIVEAGTASEVITTGRITPVVISEVALGLDDTERLALANGIINESAAGVDSASMSVDNSYWLSAFYGTITSEQQFSGSVYTDQDENVYIAGEGDGSGATNAVNIIKYDKDGNLQWQRKLDVASQDDSGYAITGDSSGNVYIAGGYNNSGNAAPPGGVRGFLVKYNSSGTLQFQQLFYPASGSQANISTRVYGITIDSSGNIYTTGVTNFSQSFVFVAKHDSSGVLQWFKTLYGSLGTDVSRGYSIKINSSGNLVVGGYIGYTVGSSVYRSPLIAIYDTSGNLLSQTRMADSSTAGGTRGSRFYSIAIDSSDNIYATGLIGSGVSSGRNGPVLCKFDSSLNLLWAVQLQSGTLSIDSPAYGVTLDSSGYVYIGFFDTPNNPDAAILVKFDSSGTLQWSNRISSSGAVTTSGIVPSNWVTTTATSLILAYTSTISSNFFAALAKVPLDGSRTGTYTVGPYGQPTTYASASLTSYTLSWSTQAASGTSASPTMTTSTASFTNYNSTQSSTTVYI